MSKNNPKKAARQRRRSRQKQLVEAGRQAEDLVSTYKQQAAEAVALAGGRLEAEVVKARQDLGEATSLLADTNKALNANATILDGLRAELDIAAQQVRMTEAERDAMEADLAKARKDLEIARTADIDTKSLRARLQHKSEEIEDLKARLRDAISSLRRATAVHGFDRTKQVGDGEGEASGSSSE